MAAHSELQKWLQQSRKSWLVLAQAALWLGAILSGFLLPPPVGVLASDEKIWLRLGQFIVAVVLGLVFFAARRWNQSRHALRWCGVALMFLAIAVAVFFRYQQLTLAWTGIYNQEKIVVGSDYTPQGQSYTQKNPKISLDDLIFDFGGEIENVWTHESISRRRLLLAATFESCLPLFTICLIAVLQAIQCGGRKAKRKAAR
jgi:hypothetical protein